MIKKEVSNSRFTDTATSFNTFLSGHIHTPFVNKTDSHIFFIIAYRVKTFNEEKQFL